MKAINIARVSTEEQREAGNSLPAQSERIDSYCKRKDFSIIKKFSFDESAYKEKRDEFDKLLECVQEIAKKEKVAVCFDKVDRLSRSVFDKRVGILYEMAVADKIELHFVSDGQIINNQMSAVAKFQFGMSLGLAKYYSDAIGDNVKRAFEKKRRNGEWIGVAPFGYKNIPLNEGKRLRKDIIPDQERKDIIVELFEKYATGNYSCRRLAEELKERNIKTKNGKPVYQSVVHHIFNNPFYYGVMRSKGKLYPHKYEPLITKKLFLQVQDIKEKRNNHPIKTIRRKDFIFNGLLKCAYCGCSMSAEIKKGKYIYYSCTNAKEICKREYVKEELLLKPIRQVMGQIKLSDEQINELISRLKETHEHQTLYHKRKIQDIDKRYNQIQERLSKIFDLFADGSITQDMYDIKLKEYKEEQTDLGIQKEELTKADEDYHVVIKTVLNLAQRASEIFESSETAEKNQLLKFLLQNSVVKGKKLEFSMRSPFNHIVKLGNCPTLLPLLNAFRTTDWKEVRVSIPSFLGVYNFVEIHS